MTRRASKTRVVLAGLGRMGRNHFRILSEEPQVELVGVIDPKAFPARTTHGAGGAAVPAFSSLEDFLAAKIGFDAAVVATATSTHFEVTKQFLERGVPTLVEKPIAATEAQGSELVRLAAAKSALLAVGHVERCNPVVSKVREIIEAGWLGQAIHFNFTRVGGYPAEVDPSNNVLVDLAVHDIDIFRYLTGGDAKLVASVSHRTLKREVYDTAEILLRGASGASASIHVNWITPTKIRQLRVTGSVGVCFANYILQTCELQGGNMLQTAGERKTDYLNLLRQYQSTDRITFGIMQEEPLKVQLRAFLRAVAGDTSGICSAEDGLASLQLSLESVRNALAADAAPALAKLGGAA